MEETTQTQETTEVVAPVADAVVTENNETTTEITYLDGKYKSVSEMENGYKELQSSYSKKLGNFDGAPDAYTRAEGIAEGDPLYGYASEWGKDNQMNDKGLNEFVEGYNVHQAEQLQAYQDEQIKALGPDAKERLQNVSDYMKANTPVDDEALQQINDGLFGAKGVEVLEALINANKQATPAAAPAIRSYDKEQITAMRFAMTPNNERRMSVDPEYRRKVEALEAEEHANRR